MTKAHIRPVVRSVARMVSRSAIRQSAGAPAAAWTPASLPAWTTDGDWWARNDLSKILKAAATPVTAYNDPVCNWLGKINSIPLEQATAGNQPKYVAGGVQFMLDVAARYLRTESGNGYGPYSQTVPRTIWAKISITATANPSAIMGLTVSGVTAAQTGFGHTNELYVVGREGYATFGAVSGTNKYILTFDGASTGQFFLNDLGVQIPGIGTAATTSLFAIGSGDGDHTVLDFGIYPGVLSASEITQLKTYLDSLT